MSTGMQIVLFLGLIVIIIVIDRVVRRLVNSGFDAASNAYYRKKQQTSVSPQSQSLAERLGQNTATSVFSDSERPNRIIANTATGSICPNCGLTLMASYSKCPKCKTPLETGPASTINRTITTTKTAGNICPNCGLTVGAGFTKCPKCKASLE